MDYIYENENYGVIKGLAEPGDVTSVERDGTNYFEFFIVWNKAQELAEYKSPVLVEALSMAAASDNALRTEAWNWHGKQAELDLTPIEKGELN